MIRRPPRSTQSRSSAASDVYKRQDVGARADLLDARDDVGDLFFGRHLVHDDHHAQLGLPSPSPGPPTSSEANLRRKNSISSSVPTLTRAHPGQPSALPSRTMAPMESKAPQTWS